MLITILLLSGSRLFYRLAMEFFTEQSDKTISKNLLIIGTGSAGNEILRFIMTNINLNYNIIGFIDDDQRNKNLSIQGIPILGTPDELSSVVKAKHIDEVIISIQDGNKDKMEKIIANCNDANVPFKKAKWTLSTI